MATEPQPALLARKKIIQNGDETAAGTVASAFANLAANYYDVVAEPGGFFDEGERQPDGNYLGEVAAVLAGQMGTIKFKMDVSPGGPLLTDNASAGALARLCGYTGSGTVTMSSSLAGRLSQSFKVFEDGRVKLFLGCQANITIDIESKKKIVANVEISGVWGGLTDASMPAQAPIIAAPFVARGLTLTMGGVSPAAVEKITIDLGAAVEPRESLASSTGIAHFLVGEVLPKATLDPEARKVADQDVYGLFLAGTTAAFAMSSISGGHTLNLTGPALQRRKVTDGKRGSRLTDAIEARFCVVNGDDGLALKDISS